MKRKIVSLTPEQAKTASEEYARLFDQAIAQLGEHQMWLQLQINDIAPGFWSCDAEYRTVLDSVTALQLGSIRVEPSPLQDQPPVVTVVYEWPDVLYAFLRRTDVPQALQRVLAGGIPLDDDTTVITPIA